MWDRKVKWQFFPCAAIIYQSLSCNGLEQPWWWLPSNTWKFDRLKWFNMRLQHPKWSRLVLLPLQKKTGNNNIPKRNKQNDASKFGAVAMKAWMIIVDSLCNQTWQRECPCLNGNMSHQWIWYRTWFVIFMGFPFFATYIPNWGYLCPLQSAYLPFL